MTPLEHATAILKAVRQAGTVSLDFASDFDRKIILTAVQAAMVDGAVQMREAALDHASFVVIGDTVRFIASDDVRALDPTAIVEGMKGHGPE